MTFRCAKSLYSQAMEMVELLSEAGWPFWLMLSAGIPLLLGLWNHLATRKQPRAPVLLQNTGSAPPSELGAALLQGLPKSVFFRQDSTFDNSVGSYWSKQNRDISPECVVIPRNEHEVSVAVRILKHDFNSCLRRRAEPPTFAVRSGGHSTVPGASNTPGGVVIALSLFRQVELAEDRASVLVGSGARWGEVSRKLDPYGRAVVGGRNSDVGVGGLTLGGGYSYFSPQYGFVCDSVLEYNIVLANGEIEVVREDRNQELWHALKGGANNFGIVTTFRLRTVQCSNVWSGFLYMFSWKASEVIRAFHGFVGGCFDESAGGPLLCISYVQQIRMTIISTHLMYTKPTPWPECWQSFGKIGRIWSSTKIRSLTSTTDELDGISPAGFRQLHTSTTVKNDLATLEHAHSVFQATAKLLKKVKCMVWTLVLQPLHTSTMRHGAHNVFGLRDRPKSLVVVLFTAVWEQTADDDLVNGSGRQAINEINEYATAKGTADEFRYLNWCDGTQRPFQSYGEENLRLLKKTCRQVDPDGFFQKACVGGHKLIED